MITVLHELAETGCRSARVAGEQLWMTQESLNPRRNGP